LRHGFPLVVEMRHTVRGVVVYNRDTGMAVGATVEGRRAMVTLSREPFMSPAPWRVVVLLSVEGNLSEGHIVVDAVRHPLPTPLPAGRPTVVWGTGCDERYAGRACRWQGTGSARGRQFCAAIMGALLATPYVSQRHGRATPPPCG
jgi:hypothetical protein